MPSQTKRLQSVQNSAAIITNLHLNMTESRRGWGSTQLCNPYSYVPPQRIGLLRRFNLKTCIDFGHFDLESVMVFEETTRCMHVFIVAIPNE